MIRVLIAEDQDLVRGALKALLNLEADLEVVADASDGVEAVELAQSCQPDIALLDIEMPRKNGLDTVRTLQTVMPACKCILVTTFAREGYLQQAMKAGARGYLLKAAKVEDLVAAIRQVYAGGTAVDPSLMQAAWTSENPLTEREIDVLRQAAQGQTTREISRSCHLSEGTVRNYLSQIISKLDAHHRQEAITIATDKGWI